MKQWWYRCTLRFRLAACYAIGGTVLLAGFSTTLYLYVAGTIAQPLEQQLREDLAEVRSRLVVGPGGRIIWDGHEVPADVVWDAEDPWFELWDSQGRLVHRFWPFDESRVERLPEEPFRGRETFSAFNVTRDLRLRMLSVPYAVPGPGEEWMIRVLSVYPSAADALGSLRWIIFIALPGVVALLYFGGYSLTRRWLKPLDFMVDEANRITADDLNRRLPVANPHDELGRLGSVFNVTLDRLENSFVTLDRFVADASHELRTPLTTLRSVGEVGLKRRRTVEEYREIIGSMLEEAQRLQLLIHRLLELARAEGGAETVQHRSIRLDEFVADCVGELSVLAEHKGMHIAVNATECSAVTDPVILRQALQNLLDNAIKYSPAGTTIDVSVGQAGEVCRMTVTDRGPGIAPEHRPYITDRFFRTGGLRGRGKAGFGLGLAITNAYMRVLGGTLNYEPAQPQGSIFSLTLPAA